MAAINTRTVLLQATSPRVLSIGIVADVAAAQAQADLALANAATAQTAANTANSSIADISSDSILSPVEKQALRLEWNAVVSEKAGINTTSAIYTATSAENTTYNSAFQALGTYLNAGVAYTISTTVPPTWINDASLGSNTAIVGSTFRSNWKVMYDARQALLNDIAVEAGKVAVWATISGTGKPADNATVGAPAGTNVGSTLAQTVESNASTALANAATANATLADIASDSILTPGEKPTIVLSYDNIVNEQSGIDAQATSYAVTTEKTTYDNAVSALTAYLGTLAGWNTIPGSNVTIVGTTFRTKFSDVYTARQAVLNKISANAKVLADAAQAQANTATTNASNAQTSANTANSAIADIASDNLLTASEKQAIRLEWNTVISEKAGINTLSSVYSATSAENTAYNSAMQTLGTYLNAGVAYTLSTSTPPTWINDASLGSNTVIVGSTFRTNWKNMYDARQALLNDIAVEAGKVAVWSSVSGSGKPADNATVGAPAGTNVAGVLAETLVTQAAAGAAADTVLSSPPVISGLTDVDEHNILNGSNRLIATLLVSMTGGEAPYTYVWSKEGSAFLTAYTGATVDLKGSGSDSLITGRITCIGRDNKGRTSSMTCAYTAGFGSM